MTIDLLVAKALQGLAQKALDVISSRLADSALDRLKPHLSRLETRIASLESTLKDHDEQTRVLHLKAGFAQLMLGNLIEARNELIRAEASDPCGALARFWLSLVLYREGRRQPAADRLAEALQLNPFIGELALGESLEWAVFQSGAPSASAPVWQVDFNTMRAALALPKRWLTLFRMGLIPSRSQAAIANISVSGINPVIEAMLGGDLRNKPEGVICVLDASSGTPVSYDLLDGQRLCFATPRFVILQSPKREGTVWFYALDKHKRVAEMSQAYFETIFCPDFVRLQSLRSFVSSNTKLLTPEEAYQETRSALRPPGFAKMSTINHRASTATYVDERDLAPPFESTLCPVRATNVWTHWHIIGRESGEQCYMSCDAKLRRRSNVQES